MKYNNFMPEFLLKSNTINELLDTEFKQIGLIKSDLEDLSNQFFIDSATWGLVIYEGALGIDIDLNKNIHERRSNIKAKLRGRGKVDDLLIKSVVDSYTNGNVDVNFKNSVITITFNDIKGVPTNIKDVKKAIEMIIPAHLALNYIYTYLTWKEFDEYNKTWKEWENLNLNWYNFERYREEDS